MALIVEKMTIFVKTYYSKFTMLFRIFAVILDLGSTIRLPRV